MDGYEIPSTRYISLHSIYRNKKTLVIAVGTLNRKIKGPPLWIDRTCTVYWIEMIYFNVAIVKFAACTVCGVIIVFHSFSGRPVISTKLIYKKRVNQFSIHYIFVRLCIWISKWASMCIMYMIRNTRYNVFLIDLPTGWLRGQGIVEHTWTLIDYTPVILI